MNRFLFFCLLALVPGILMAQKKSVTLESANSFYAKRVYGFVSMNDGLRYSVMGDRSRSIDVYSYATGKKETTLINLEELKDCPVKNIAGYELNATETQILLYTDVESVYRHSFKASYYIYDIARKELKPLSDKGKQQMATFSPNGEMVAYVRDNNLFVAKLRFGTESAITTDGAFNKVINGLPDWVYEEEFGYNKAFEWSPDSKELAYVRFDESQVREFSFPLYKASFPAMEEYALYPGSYSFKYPKAGEKNSDVSVRVFNVKDRTTKVMDTGNEKDIYIPRIRWTMEPEKLGIIRLNRLQNQLDLIVANTTSSLGNVIFTQRNEFYVDENVLDNLIFLPDGKHFIYVGEMDGYNHIYLYSMAGRKVAQLTSGAWDVTAFLGFDPVKKLVYYESAERSPIKRDIYVVGMDGKNKKRIIEQDGTNSAVFSATYKYIINAFSNTETPTITTLHDSKGKLIRVLEANEALKEKVKEYNIAKKEFFSFKTSEGVELNGWMMKPIDFDPAKQYPVLMTQYSGPNSQQVRDVWGIGWEQYLVANGYVVACVDPRGTGARGEAFRKCTYMKLGKYESDDQIEAAKYLGSLSYIDAGRIGIWGWSYGGFMTLSCLSKSDVFKVGISIAPVTNWRYYDSVYTERFMRRPVENASGYDDNSPISMAKNLKGKLLLIHGTADDNVHFQNTMEYVDRLVQEGKQFRLFTYPNRNHGMGGGKSRAHLNRMVSDFIFENL
jgi:dipeptidyl-peptidase-4